MKATLLKSPRLRLFLISFIILFFELVCIRWLSAYVLYLGYFTNFVLLGCFLGIGTGALLANKRVRLIKHLPLMLFLFFPVIIFSRAQVTPEFEGLIYFTSSTAVLRLPSYILLPLIFMSITAIFAFLSQDLGNLLNEFPPLQAYRINILGSLLGIAVFTLMGLLRAPSWVWFTIAIGILILLLPADRSLGRNIILLAGLVLVIIFSDYIFANIWSPYSRLNLMSEQDNQLVRKSDPYNQDMPDDAFSLFSNSILIQAFAPISPGKSNYELPYTAFDQKPTYENVLVIGAGGGNDVAYALANGVEHVDAVEIDPLIVELGKIYHPEAPFQNPRVSVYTEDGRAFLEHATQKYDLIIFALTDSLVLASSSSNIRLESYLFTTESFERIKSLLKPDGLFMLYNYYRYDWLVDKIASMLTEVFGEAPIYHPPGSSVEGQMVYVSFFAGPKASEIDIQQSDFYQSNPTHFIPATDNWPFLYLNRPSLPTFYSLTIIIILITSGLFIWRVSPKGALTKSSLPFFFMGAAFTLLETKSIVNFLLLFGATWLVNSLVFFGILLMVLVAIWLSSRYKFTKAWILYAVLFATITLNFFIPLKSLLFGNLVLRYLIATIFLFSPIFIANLIYSSAFRDTSQANIAFGANLLGTIVGGASEYLSLYTGYQALALLAGLFYFAAFIFFIYAKKANQPIR